MSEDIGSMFFPVELRDVFVPTYTVEKELFGSRKTGEKLRKIPRMQAVYDVEQCCVFAVVSGNYRLVTNREAVDLGRKCFNKVFSLTGAQNLEVYNITTPKTRSFCHIDFCHKEFTFTPWQDDPWFPFLRVTNSYNRTYPLRFEIGFCRGICKNGVIFTKDSIRIKFLHMKSQLGTRVDFDIRIGSLRDYELQFIESLCNLKRYYVPEKYMFPLVCKALGINITPPATRTERQAETFKRIKMHIRQLTKSYVKEFGPNGYTALNVISDMATRPVGTISAAQVTDAFQKKTGDWMREFLEQVESETFVFEAYLGDYLEKCA
jgi:hypothetical protein